MFVAGKRSIGRGCSRPAVCRWVVFPAGLYIGERETVVIDQAAPNDHFGPRPDGAKIESPGRRTSGGGRDPTITRRIISAAGVEIDVIDLIPAAPDDHFSACPNPLRTEPRGRRIGGGSSRPGVSAWAVLAAGVGIATSIVPCPDNHLAASPDGGVIVARGGGAGSRCRRPSVS